MGQSSSELWTIPELNRLKEMSSSKAPFSDVLKAFPDRSGWAIIWKLRTIILKQNYDDLTWVHNTASNNGSTELFNHYDYWTTPQRKQLKDYFEGDTELGQIGKLLGKTDRAIIIELAQLYSTRKDQERVYLHLCERKRLIRLTDALNFVQRTDLTSVESAKVPDICRKFATNAAFMICKMKGHGNDDFIVQTAWPQCVFQLIPFESSADYNKYEKKTDPKFKLFNQKQVHEKYWKIGLLFIDCMLKVDDNFPDNLLKKITNNAAYDAAEWFIAYSKLSK